MIARSDSDPLVTDRRILTARQLRDPSRGRAWVLDPLAFDQIVGWSKGEHHDGRPILRLTHHPLTRITRVPARRFLWWNLGQCGGVSGGDNDNPGVREAHEPGLPLDRRRTRSPECPRGPVVRDQAGRQSRSADEGIAWISRGLQELRPDRSPPASSGARRLSDRARLAPPGVGLDRGRGARLARITLARRAGDRRQRVGVARRDAVDARPAHGPHRLWIRRIIRCRR